MAFDSSTSAEQQQNTHNNAPNQHRLPDRSANNEEDESWNVDNWNNEVFKFEQNSLIKNKLGLVVNKRYQIVQRIDAGAFGSTYIGEDLKNNRQRVAVKFDTGKSEWKKTKKDENHLKYEFEVYKSALYDDGFDTVEGFAQVFWFGFQYGHNILVMELLGASVASLFTFCDRKFGWQTVLSLAQQMLCRIKHIHQRGFIHRDLKPENFLMGLSEKEATCYLIDFGLARRYRFRHPEDRTLKHIPFRRGRSFIGTAKYASVNSHRSVELSRRDDLESLGYVLIELINGHLPWRNICRRNQNNKHQTYMRIRSAKEQAQWDLLCPPMAEYMRHCRALQFAEEPDYDKLMTMLRMNLADGDQKPTFPLMMPLLRCEACRALNANRGDICLTIGRIEEEKEPSPPSVSPPPADPQARENFEHPSMLKPSGSLNFLSSTLPNPHDPAIDRLALQLGNISTGPCHSGSFFIPNLPPPTVKIPQLGVNFSQPSSLDNLKSNPGANVELNLLGRKANSECTTEEDAESVKSCHNCRQQKGSQSEREFRTSDARLSWQIWRDSTPENRFEYDNRFSWTLPALAKPLSNFSIAPLVDFSKPPPNHQPAAFQYPPPPPQQQQQQPLFNYSYNPAAFPRPGVYASSSSSTPIFDHQNQAVGPNPAQNGFFTSRAPVFCMIPAPSTSFGHFFSK